MHTGLIPHDVTRAVCFYLGKLPTVCAQRAAQRNAPGGHRDGATTAQYVVDHRPIFLFFFFFFLPYLNALSVFFLSPRKVRNDNHLRASFCAALDSRCRRAPSGLFATPYSTALWLPVPQHPADLREAIGR